MQARLHTVLWKSTFPDKKPSLQAVTPLRKRVSGRPYRLFRACQALPISPGCCRDWQCGKDVGAPFFSDYPHSPAKEKKRSGAALAWPSLSFSPSNRKKVLHSYLTPCRPFSCSLRYPSYKKCGTPQLPGKCRIFSFRGAAPCSIRCPWQPDGRPQPCLPQAGGLPHNGRTPR